MEKITKKMAAELFCEHETLYLYWSREEVTVDQAFTNPNMNVGWRKAIMHSDYIMFGPEEDASRLYLMAKGQKREFFREKYNDGYVIKLRITHPNGQIFMYYYYKA